MKNRTFKKLFIVVSTVLILILLSSCFYDSSLPVYKKTDEDGISVYIDGVRYKQLPKLKWELQAAWYIKPEKDQETYIGYAGDWKTEISKARGDTENNFIFIKGTLADYYDGYLYRADRIIPEPSAESINELTWVETYIDGEGDYYNKTTDTKVIKELFHTLNTGIKSNNYNMIQKHSKNINMYISCKSDNLPGAEFILHIGTSDGRIICGSFIDDEYTEIPIDLLEKIAGKRLDF